MKKALDYSSIPELKSERLNFRKLNIEDAKDIFEIRSNDQAMKFMDSDFHQSITDSEKFVQRNIDAQRNSQGVFWVIIEKETGNIIGDFSFWSIDHKNQRAEIGYSLKPDFWGKKYMCEALNTLLKFGFNNLGIHSFEANVNPKNEASKQCLINVGFQKEAYFRENYYYNGQFLDSEIYCILKSDMA